MSLGNDPARLIIRQPERGYRFSIDSVILAGFAAPLCRGAVLDLGTGCGVLLLLLSRLAPGMFTGTGVDLQEDLLDFARRNFRDNRPDGRLVASPGDFRGEIPGVEPGSFDLVVSNPPYVDPAAAADLSTEVVDHEPAIALFAPASGRQALARLVGAAATSLAPGARMMLEVGHDQATEVAEHGTASGLQSEGVTEDLAGIPRVVRLRRPER
jgi:HemK-like putative methylase